MVGRRQFRRDGKISWLVLVLVGLRALGTQQAETQTSTLGAPTNLKAAALNREPNRSAQVQLNWDYAGTDHTAFELWRKEGTASYERIATVSANVRTFLDVGPRQFTLYSYVVRATSGPGAFSAYSNEVRVAIPEDLPTAPSDLTVTAISPTAVRLDWRDNSENEAEFHIRLRRPWQYGEDDAGLIARVPRNETTYTLVGLNPGTTYFFRVWAVHNGGTSDATLLASATTPARAPSTPSGLTTTAVTSSQINLRWSDSDIETGYQIDRKTASGSFQALALVGANVTSFADTGLVVGTAYTYRVRALVNDAPSAWSNESTVATPSAAPAAPTALLATAVSESGIDLVWADNSTDETGFEVERKTAGGSFSRVTTVGANVTRYSDGGLTPGTSYVYRLRAVNSGGASGYTDEASATTLRPTSVAFVALPSPVMGGSDVTGIVTLDAPAPSGGLTITLISSAPTAANPATASLVFSTGEVAKTFRLSTTAVTAATTVTITARANGYDKAALVSLRP
jgi:fibronectin type 3 domain-containing protein